MTKERHPRGSLRDRLIEESRRLISLHGAESFRIADACRAAGVTTAAPYKHFENREELIGEISAMGFRELTERMRAAHGAHEAGSIEGLIAMGRAYIGYANDDPEMFHLMWGSSRQSVKHDAMECDGKACFQFLLDAIAAMTARLGWSDVDLREIALPLWSGIHGLAWLKLSDRLDVIEGVAIDKIVDLSTRAFIDGLRQRYGESGADTPF